MARPESTFERRALAALAMWALSMATDAYALVGPASEAPELEPYVVVVLDHEGERTSYCTASVVARDVVLTAAHCVTSPDTTQILVKDEQGESALLDVTAIAIHPGFRPDAARRRLLSIDLALLRLAEPLPPRFLPVDLPRSDKPEKPEVGQRFRIAGYGISEEGAGGVLRAGIVAAAGPRSPALLWVVDPDGTGLGACTGDSGAPILAAHAPSLVAVAEWAKGVSGQRCGASTQAVLVAPQRAWLERVLQAWAPARPMRP